MDVNRLSDDELKYEITIRGYPLVTDINIMRDLLRGSLRTTENHLENFVLLDAKDEIFICTAKLRELKVDIDNLNGDHRSESFKTADTKLNHLLARIERITTEDPVLLKQRSILLKTILHLMQEASSKTQMNSNSNNINVEQYSITPVTRTLIVKNKMSTNSSPIAPIMAKKDDEVGVELFSHQGVALKKKNSEQKVETIPGTLSIFQYVNGKYIEWKPFDPSFESENVGTDCEWDVVDAVRRRTTSTSSNVEGSQPPPIRIAMKDFRTYKIKHGRQISIMTTNDTRYSFLFQSGDSDGFISSIRAILKTQRIGKSRTTFLVLGEREESKTIKSFNDLKIFPDHTENHNVWNFMRNLQTRPYETTLETFSKLTDTLLYRTPEHRPMDAEVAELLTKSLHIEDSDRNLESDFAIIGDIENIVLAPRNPVKRGEPLTYERWTMSLDSEGRVRNPEEVRNIIFKGGVEPSLRKTLWKYLLNFYPWTSSSDECHEVYKKKIEEYCVMKRQWQTMTPGQEMRFSSYRERKNLIDKDVNRTDRTLAYYAGDDNRNLRSLNDILMTYVMFNFDLGYVQGMSDLLSPILYLLDHEIDAFWCFVGFMERVVRNFDFDQAGMKKQLSELYAILKVVVPDLADYLKKHESSNMFFCFRGLLVHFKREFTLEDIMRLWEVLWTDVPCPNFHLLICVAILDMEKKALMEEGNGFTEILKHVNELSCRMNLNKVLAEAESIYEQLKASGDNVPLNVRRIIGLAPPQDESDISEEESYVNTTYPATASLKTSDDNDSITDDMEKVTFGPSPGDIGFEGIERAMSMNYY